MKRRRHHKRTHYNSSSSSSSSSSGSSSGSNGMNSEEGEGEAMEEEEEEMVVIPVGRRKNPPRISSSSKPSSPVVTMDIPDSNSNKNKNIKLDDSTKSQDEVKKEDSSSSRAGKVVGAALELTKSFSSPSVLEKERLTGNKRNRAMIKEADHAGDREKTGSSEENEEEKDGDTELDVVQNLLEANSEKRMLSVLQTLLNPLAQADGKVEEKMCLGLVCVVKEYTERFQYPTIIKFLIRLLRSKHCLLRQSSGSAFEDPDQRPNRGIPLPCVVANLLTYILRNNTEWPLDSVKVFLDDSLNSRSWIDHDLCKPFIDNILTVLTPYQPGPSDIPPSQDEVLPLVCHRFRNPSTYEKASEVLTAHLQARCSEIGHEKTAFVPGSVSQGETLRNLMLTLSSLASIPQIRILVSKNIEAWLQNPTLKVVARELLVKVAGLCTSDSNADGQVADALLKMKLKSKMWQLHLDTVLQLVSISDFNLRRALKLFLLRERPNNLAKGADNMKMLITIFKAIRSPSIFDEVAPALSRTVDASSDFRTSHDSPAPSPFSTTPIFTPHSTPSSSPSLLLGGGESVSSSKKQLEMNFFQRPATHSGSHISDQLAIVVQELAMDKDLAGVLKAILRKLFKQMTFELIDPRSFCIGLMTDRPDLAMEKQLGARERLDWLTTLSSLVVLTILMRAAIAKGATTSSTQPLPSGRGGGGGVLPPPGALGSSGSGKISGAPMLTSAGSIAARPVGIRLKSTSHHTSASTTAATTATAGNTSNSNSSGSGSSTGLYHATKSMHTFPSPARGGVSSTTAGAAAAAADKSSSSGSSSVLSTGLLSAEERGRETFVQLLASIHRVAVDWLYITWGKYFEGSLDTLEATVYVSTLRSLLQLEFPSSSSNVSSSNSLSTEHDRACLAYCQSEVPMHDSLVPTIVAMAQSSLPLSVLEALHILESIIRRAALGQRHREKLWKQHNQSLVVYQENGGLVGLLQNVNVTKQLFQLIQIPIQVPVPSLQEKAFFCHEMHFWKISMILVMLGSFNPGLYGETLWEQYPTIRCLLQMIISNSYIYPPMRMCDPKLLGSSLHLKEQNKTLQDDAVALDDLGTLWKQQENQIAQDLFPLPEQRQGLMLLDPFAFARKPPVEIFDQLKKLNEEMKLNLNLIQCRSPDFLMDMIQDDQPLDAPEAEDSDCLDNPQSRNLTWIADVISREPESLNYFPSSCVCQLTLMACSHVTKGNNESSESTRAFILQLPTMINRLRKIVFDRDQLDASRHVILFFLNRLTASSSSSSSSSSLLTSSHLFCRRASSLALDYLFSDASVVDTSPPLTTPTAWISESPSFNWLLNLSKVPGYDRLQMRILQVLQEILLQGSSLETSRSCITALFSLHTNAHANKETALTIGVALGTLFSSRAILSKKLLEDNNVCGICIRVLHETMEMTLNGAGIPPFMHVVEVFASLDASSANRRKVSIPFHCINGALEVVTLCNFDGLKEPELRLYHNMCQFLFLPDGKVEERQGYGIFAVLDQNKIPVCSFRHLRRLALGGNLSLATVALDCMDVSQYWDILMSYGGKRATVLNVLGRLNDLVSRGPPQDISQSLSIYCDQKKQLGMVSERKNSSFYRRTCALVHGRILSYLHLFYGASLPDEVSAKFRPLLSLLLNEEIDPTVEQSGTLVLPSLLLSHDVKYQRASFENVSPLLEKNERSSFSIASMNVARPIKGSILGDVPTEKDTIDSVGKALWQDEHEPSAIRGNFCFFDKVSHAFKHNFQSLVAKDTHMSVRSELEGLMKGISHNFIEKMLTLESMKTSIHSIRLFLWLVLRWDMRGHDTISKVTQLIVRKYLGSQHEEEELHALEHLIKHCLDAILRFPWRAIKQSMHRLLVSCTDLLQEGSGSANQRLFVAQSMLEFTTHCMMRLDPRCNRLASIPLTSAVAIISPTVAWATSLEMCKMLLRLVVYEVIDVLDARLFREKVFARIHLIAMVAFSQPEYLLASITFLRSRMFADDRWVKAQSRVKDIVFKMLYALDTIQMQQLINEHVVDWTSEAIDDDWVYANNVMISSRFYIIVETHLSRLHKEDDLPSFIKHCCFWCPHHIQAHLYPILMRLRRLTPNPEGVDHEILVKNVIKLTELLFVSGLRGKILEDVLNQLRIVVISFSKESSLLLLEQTNFNLLSKFVAMLQILLKIDHTESCNFVYEEEWHHDIVMMSKMLPNSEQMHYLLNRVQNGLNISKRCLVLSEETTAVLKMAFECFRSCKTDKERTDMLKTVESNLQSLESMSKEHPEKVATLVNDLLWLLRCNSIILLPAMLQNALTALRNHLNYNALQAHDIVHAFSILLKTCTHDQYETVASFCIQFYCYGHFQDTEAILLILYTRELSSNTTPTKSTLSSLVKHMSKVRRAKQHSRHNSNALLSATLTTVQHPSGSSSSNQRQTSQATS